MDIITFASQLEQELKASKTGDENMLVATSKMLNQVMEVVRQLRQAVITYRFKDKHEEVTFFKEVKPVLLSQYYFYKSKFSLVLFDTYRDRESRLDNYYQHLQKMEHYVTQHQAFYAYCMSGATSKDQAYFVRNNHYLEFLDTDDQFSTGYDHILARFLAMELERDYVKDAIQSLEREASQQPGILTWTASKVALVELVYALYSVGCFNQGNAELKQIVALVEGVFNINLGHYNRTFSEIRIRKSGQTNFLDHLKDRLLDLMNDFD